jgi:hypothetical protein
LVLIIGDGDIIAGITGEILIGEIVIGVTILFGNRIITIGAGIVVFMEIDGTINIGVMVIILITEITDIIDIIDITEI